MNPSIEFEPTVSIEEFDEKYEALLNEYNKVKDEIKVIKSAKTIDIQIEKYDQKISQLQNSQINGDSTTQDSFILSTNNQSYQQAKIHELETNIRTQEKLLQERRSQNETNILEVNNKIEQKSRQLQQIRSSATSVSSQVDPKQQQIEKLKNQIQQLINQIGKQQGELKQLEQKVKAQEQQSLFILESQNKKNNEKTALQQEIIHLKNNVDSQQRILQALKNKSANDDAQAGNARKNQEAEYNIAKQKSQKLSVQIQKLKKDKAIINEQFNNSNKAHEKASQKEKQLKQQIEDKKRIEEKIKKCVEKMKEEKDQLYEEKKKKKTKPAFDVKHQILRLEKDNEGLEKERKRQSNKLKEYIQIRKSYVKTDQLVKVKQELDKYRMLNKPFEKDIKTLAKLEEEQKRLRESIKTLRGTQKNIINEKQSALNQAKDKVKQLLENKTFYERNILHCKNKLNEYIKQFPDHQKKKNELKLQQKRQQAEQKRLKKEQQQLKITEDKKGKKQKNSKKNKNDQQQGNEDSHALQMINKTQNNNESILNNQFVQIGGASLLALIGFGVYSIM